MVSFCESLFRLKSTGNELQIFAFRKTIDTGIWYVEDFVILARNSLIAPAYFSSYFVRLSDIHNCVARQSTRLSLPRAKIVNEVLTDIMNTGDLQTFSCCANSLLCILIFRDFYQLLDRY